VIRRKLLSAWRNEDENKEKCWWRRQRLKIKASENMVYILSKTNTAHMPSITNYN
jgi:hypothetical protein